jgi:hypothetical protein
MENRDVRTTRTALRSADGQVSGSPTAVRDQSRALIARPTSPPSANRERSTASWVTGASPGGW